MNQVDANLITTEDNSRPKAAAAAAAATAATAATVAAAAEAELTCLAVANDNVNHSKVNNRSRSSSDRWKEKP